MKKSILKLSGYTWDLAIYPHISFTGEPVDTYTSGMTYIFDHITEQWSSGPSMLEGRYRFGCGKFNSATHEDREIIVVAGGYSGSDGYPFGKVEFLDFSGDNT